MSMLDTKGERVTFDLATELLEPGQYGKASDGTWRARPPESDYMLTANLSKHVVTEHEDGTISVQPSILVEKPLLNSVVRWHGCLDHGVWKES